MAGPGTGNGDDEKRRIEQGRKTSKFGLSCKIHKNNEISLIATKRCKGDS